MICCEISWVQRETGTDTREGFNKVLWDAENPFKRPGKAMSERWCLSCLKKSQVSPENSTSNKPGWDTVLDTSEGSTVCRGEWGVEADRVQSGESSQDLVEVAGPVWPM